jgi:hypothetical protein
MRKFTWKNLRGLLSMGNKRKFISLSNHYIFWYKHLNNGIQNLTRWCCQMSSKSMKLINIFMWKTQINITSLYVSIWMIGSNGHMIKSIKKILTNMFDIKDLGVVDVIPDIKTYRTSDWLILFSHLIMFRKFSINFLKVKIVLLKHQ